MDQYGYWVLFFGLMVELIAFGIPEPFAMFEKPHGTRGKRKAKIIFTPK